MGSSVDHDTVGCAGGESIQDWQVFGHPPFGVGQIPEEGEADIRLDSSFKHRLACPFGKEVHVGETGGAASDHLGDAKTGCGKDIRGTQAIFERPYFGKPFLKMSRGILVIAEVFHAQMRVRVHQPRQRDHARGVRWSHRGQNCPADHPRMRFFLPLIPMDPTKQRPASVMGMMVVFWMRVFMRAF